MADPILNISDGIAAIAKDQVARITGLSKRRLRYWAKTASSARASLKTSLVFPYSRFYMFKFYTFKDLVALRTLGRLRDQHKVPLQHLRVAAARLRELNDDVWTATRLYVANRRVVVVDPTTRQREDVASGRCLLAIAALASR